MPDKPLPPELASAYEQLKKIRASKTVALKPTPMLRTDIKGLDGKTQPLRLRYYQVQGIYHLLMMRRMILSDGTGLGKCVTGDTLLSTNRGLIPIADLAPKGELTPDTFYDLDTPVRVNLGGKFVPVRKFYWNGEVPTYRVRTRDGYVIQGSANHPILVRSPEGEGFVKLPAVQEAEHYVCVERRGSFAVEPPAIPFAANVSAVANRYNAPTHLTPELSRLLGYVVAEGTVTSRYHTTVTQHETLNPEPHQDIRNLLAAVFGWENRDKYNSGGHESIQVSSIWIRQYLAACGVEYTTARYKTVPWCILQGTREDVKQFLRGMFEGEANTGNGSIEFSTASERLAQELQLLLLQFGVLSTRKPKTVKGYDHTYWRLFISGESAVTFAAEIGFVSTRKQQALVESLSATRNPNKDVIPYGVELASRIHEALLESAKGPGLKQFGETFCSKLSHARRSTRNLTYGFLRELEEACLKLGLDGHPTLLELQGLLGSHYYYDPVVEVIEAGVQPVMDIEVDDPQHAFTANGIVNHNTLQIIGTLCYLWQKEPHARPVIVAPKSAVRQWAGEFEKFTHNVKTYVVSGTLEERKKVYSAWAKHPMDSDVKPVLLINYHPLVRDWDHGAGTKKANPKDKGSVEPGLLHGIMRNAGSILVAFDECFDYHTPIQLADGTTELIGRIVSKRMEVVVQSWNWATNEVEPKKVTNWYRNPLRRGKQESLIKIRSRFGGVVNVTRSHNFYKVGGTKVQVRNLKVGSEIASLAVAPTSDQEQIILGGLLGDASVSHDDRNTWGVSFCQSTKQEEYLSFKREVLSSLGVSSIYQTEFQSGDQQMCRFRLYGSGAVTSMLVSSGCWEDGRKKLTAEFLDRLTPLGLAVWYGDDGSIDEHVDTNGNVTRRITLHTQGFSRAENELLAGYLRWRWGVGVRVRSTYKKQTGKRYYYLYLPAKETAKFLALLPGAFPGVEYKYPNAPVLAVSDLNCSPKQTVVKDWVLSMEEWQPDSRKKYVYDIEVEDNHNYFANGVLVSNCTAFKNVSTKTWQVVAQLSRLSDRAYGLTATLLKNNLMEGFSIYKAIVPDLFSTKAAFINDYCVTRLMPVGGGRSVPLVVGYRNLQHFRDKIDPFFLGRAKHVVSDELPTLVTKEITCELGPAEDAKYSEALSGVFELGDGQVKDYEEHKAFVSLIYCQQVVNSLATLKFEAGTEIEAGMFRDEYLKVDKLGAKEQALLDLIVDELDGEKVIVYSRFESVVGRLQHILAEAKIKSARITGKENDKARRASQEKFQDLESDTKVIFITDAGSEAINLQAASAMIFYDAPWSWGNYVQCLDEKTQVLTQRGFLGREEIQTTDIVAAFDPQTEAISWQPIRSMVDRPLGAGEEMYAYSSPHLDIRVTGGHRMVYKRPTTKNKKSVWPSGWSIQQAHEMPHERSHYQIPVCGVQEAPGLDLSDDQLRFLGWYLTDGCLNKRTGQIEISQAVHQPQLIDLRKCLESCGFDFKEYARDPSVYESYPNGKPQVVFVIPKGTGRGSRKRQGWCPLEPYLDKDFSPLFENLDARQLGILLEAIHLGDGDKMLGQTWTRRSYHIGSARKTFVDRLQSLCVRRGYRCNVAERVEKSGNSFYILHIKPGVARSLKGGTPERPHFQKVAASEGEHVWCIENDVGTLLTRRNGKVAVVGNCLGRPIRIGSPHQHIVCYHLIAERPRETKKDRKTIDHHVLALLQSKKNLIDKVLGEAAVGALQFDKGTGTKDLVRRMQGHGDDE